VSEPFGEPSSPTSRPVSEPRSVPNGSSGVSQPGGSSGVSTPGDSSTPGGSSTPGPVPTPRPPVTVPVPGASEPVPRRPCDDGEVGNPDEPELPEDDDPRATPLFQNPIADVDLSGPFGVAGFEEPGFPDETPTPRDDERRSSLPLFGGGFL